eukprot:IDg3547t1
MYLKPTEASHAFFVDLKQSLSHFCTPEEETIFLTEVLQKNDPRIFTAEMAAARRKEITGLIDRGTFEVICQRDVPSNSHMLPARFCFRHKVNSRRRHSGLFAISKTTTARHFRSKPGRRLRTQPRRVPSPCKPLYGLSESEIYGMKL